MLNKDKDNTFEKERKSKLIQSNKFPYKKNLIEISENIEAMRKFSETYAKRTNTFFCALPDVTAMVIIGLGTNKDLLGAPLCPCRHYDDNQAEADSAYWNCPCVPMRERKECHCMLFLTTENDYASSFQEINTQHFEMTVDFAPHLWKTDHIIS